MIHLIKLELKKNRIRKYIIISAFLILFSVLFITVSLIDSATDPTQNKDTFDNIFRLIEVLLPFIYIVFYGVLVSTIIIKEYNVRTILIMFSYPVDRKKIIGAKLLMISSFIALSLMAGYFLCCGYVIGADYFFDLLADQFHNDYLINWILRMLITTIVCVCIGLLTFVVGMINKSVPLTIVCSLLFIFLRQIALTSSYGYTENLLQTLIIIVITVICLYHSLSYKMNQIE